MDIPKYTDHILKQLHSLISALPGCITHYTIVAPTGMESDVILHFHTAIVAEFPEFRHSAHVLRPGGVEIDLRVSFDKKDVMPDVKLGVLYIAGRYLKHSRDVSQSPWFQKNGERVGATSLQEIVANPIIGLTFPNDAKRRRCSTEQKPLGHNVGEYQAEDQECYKFVAAGREDIDVRMLGEGRPFLLHILGPLRVPTQGELDRVMQAFEDDPTTAVDVRGLRVVTSDASQQLLDGQEKKTKTYRCVVYFKRPIFGSDPAVACINGLKDLAIQQQTPVRVLHRRSLLTRERIIHSAHLDLINPHWGVLDLMTSAGTYVKEFVFGDHGRTVPSLGTLLGTTCDIIQLDVTQVDMEW
eukprot:PhF_6_TR41013/c0_g1_i1/m.62122/K07583/PUS10; tRNA pseudouridine synthase 10